jgi:hypothetical protein
VFIKDTWRVDLLDIEREGETYELMVRAQVRNIALCSAAGDIRDHHMVTHLYANKPWAWVSSSHVVMTLNPSPTFISTFSMVLFPGMALNTQ